MSDYQQLLHNFEQLGLHRMKEYFPNYLELMNNQSIPFTEAFLELTNQELLYKDEKKIERALKKARFPKIKRMMDFDFGYQPSINKQQVLDLQHLSFLDKQENLLFIGSPGVGKSHLATSIGICACKQGVRTLFINCHELLLRLQSAYENNTIERVMKRYANYDLLIIDEIGYLPIHRQEADLLFQLINARYERHSTIFTTNSPLSNWSEIFRNPTATAAILDRLVHHSQIFKITGKSYRLRDHQESIQK
ncbi:MAG: IS21-like element helper ATPase IstB [Enterococcus aquimarinus]